MVISEKEFCLHDMKKKYIYSNFFFKHNDSVIKNTNCFRKSISFYINLI